MADLAYNSSRSLMGTWTFPQAFSGAPFVPQPTLPVSSGRFTNMNLNQTGDPTFVAGPGETSATIHMWSNAQPYSAGQAARVDVFAIGRY